MTPGMVEAITSREAIRTEGAVESRELRGFHVEQSSGEAVRERTQLCAAVGYRGQWGQELWHCHTPSASSGAAHLIAAKPAARSWMFYLCSIAAGTAPAALGTAKCLWAGRGLICWAGAVKNTR